MLDEDHTRANSRGPIRRAFSCFTGSDGSRPAPSVTGLVRGGPLMPGYPAEMLAECVKKAFDEVLNDHPEFDPVVGEFALLIAEALTTSPSFSWAGGNIWSDIDDKVRN